MSSRCCSCQGYLSCSKAKSHCPWASPATPGPRKASLVTAATQTRSSEIYQLLTKHTMSSTNFSGSEASWGRAQCIFSSVVYTEWRRTETWCVVCVCVCSEIRFAVQVRERVDVILIRSDGTRDRCEEWQVCLKDVRDDRFTAVGCGVLGMKRELKVECSAALREMCR